MQPQYLLTASFGRKRVHDGAGDIELNPGPVSTPTPTICVRLIQWNANGISGKMTELLSFLHSNNDNITAIQETKLTNRNKPLISPGWTALRLDRHKNKGGGLLMLIIDTIPFDDNSVALQQSADPHLEQQGISIAMPNRPQLHIHNTYIPPLSSCSDGHNASIAHLLSNKGMSVIAGDINTHHSRWDRNTNEEERGEQLADDAADNTIIERMKLRGYRQMACQLRLTSVWHLITSHYYYTSQCLTHWPAIICPSLSPSKQKCPRMIGLGEPTSTS